MEAKHRTTYPFAVDGDAPVTHPRSTKDFENDITDIEGAFPKSLLFSEALHRVPEVRRHTLDVADINCKPQRKSFSFADRANLYDPSDINLPLKREQNRQTNPIDPVYDWQLAESAGPCRNQLKCSHEAPERNATLRTDDIFGKEEAVERMMRTKYGRRTETHHFTDVSDINGPRTGGLTYYEPSHSTKVNPFYDYDFFREAARNNHIQKEQVSELHISEGRVNNNVLEHQAGNTLNVAAGKPAAPEIAVCHESVGCLPGPGRDVYLRNAKRFERTSGELQAADRSTTAQPMKASDPPLKCINLKTVEQ